MADLTAMMQAAAGAGEDATFIEDVFSTYLYTNDIYPSNLTITNGIDLSGKGGLVWMKNRSLVRNHNLYDTARGALKQLRSDSTGGQITNASGFGLTAFNANGFSLGTDIDGENVSNVVSWTFREQPKFFDVVTYTGNGANRTIAHNLGSVPGCIIIKDTSAVSNWYVYHRSLATNEALKLNSTAAIETAATLWNNTAATSSVFSLGTAGDVNGNGDSFVAYVFAHDAGGFGLTGTDNVISCGTFTTDGSGNATVTLGYEPQWLLVKASSGVGGWIMSDIMRGFPANSGSSSRLLANTSAAETTGSTVPGQPTATGFIAVGDASTTYIYIAVRRGPMKVPTVGTSVFGMSARSGTGANVTVTGGQTNDAVLIKNRGSAVASLFSSRLTDIGYLVTSTDAAEALAGPTILQANPWDVMDGVKVGTTSTITNASANTYINYLFKRAPSVFDVVCYTGTGSATTFSHNLAAVPELMIVKKRSAAGTDWNVYSSALGATQTFYLNQPDASVTSSGAWNDTTPTSSVFTVGTSGTVNASAATYVAYLFVTCPGVSKVGSYTGTGTTLQVDCGFTAGSRFVLIKRTDDVGDWYVWDSARGIVAGNDPYFLLNSAAAEVTNTDYVDTYSAGFEISSTAPAAINASGGTFIFLAIA